MKNKVLNEEQLDAVTGGHADGYETVDEDLQGFKVGSKVTFMHNGEKVHGVVKLVEKRDYSNPIFGNITYFNCEVEFTINGVTQIADVDSMWLQADE